jgi:hypothetical protein
MIELMYCLFGKTGTLIFVGVHAILLYVAITISFFKMEKNNG